MHTPVCHDFKSPRTDTSKRLPSSFMLVPVLFYICVLGGIVLNISAYLRFHDATLKQNSFTQQQAEHESTKAQLETQEHAVEKEKIKAEKLAQWIEGTRTLQPLSVAIMRSIPAEITISDMNFERSTDIPAQINLNVRINNGSMEEVSHIQSSLQNLNYRPYNSQQLKSGETLEYKTMLVFQQL